ncbi:MAG: OmpA family protein [Candidatus Thiodiazotropha sp. (ex Dulcina madagascariensis)]|nr:OmpA family protein [Candidatus Thiodiazotropha sp. (ex Dulcina madagascariensis)]MCU7927212.1 OmpA family protein [Candidatus Thiodiazotropha sp. (ex Dulcina madagascariensis)]
MVSTRSKEGPLDAVSWYAWETEETDAGWLLTYVDVLSVILAMLVVLLGQMAMQRPQPPEVESETVDVIRELPVIAGKATPQASAESISAESLLISAIETRFQDEVRVVQREQGISLEIADVILFNSSRAKLRPEAQPVLSRLAETLQEIGEANISVEGHTDDRPIRGGRFQSNWELAAARANAVTRFLLNQGFSAKRLRSISYADARPVADNANPAGRAENRRVNLRVEFL